MTKSDKHKTSRQDTKDLGAHSQTGPGPKPTEGGTPNLPPPPEGGIPNPSSPPGGRTPNETLTTTALSPDQLEQLKAKAAKADEHWDRLLRTAAELDNFRKRAARDRQDALRMANENLLQKLIPVLDNFEGALAAAGKSQSEHAQSLQSGVAMICSQLKAALAEAGLEEIDATNQPFDPNWHEAISQVETDDAPEGHVVQQLRKGYKLRERLLRPASVVVARKPADKATSDAAGNAPSLKP